MNKTVTNVLFNLLVAELICQTVIFLYVNFNGVIKSGFKSCTIGSKDLTVMLYRSKKPVLFICAALSCFTWFTNRCQTSCNYIFKASFCFNRVLCNHVSFGEIEICLKVQFLSGAPLTTAQIFLFYMVLEKLYFVFKVLATSEPENLVQKLLFFLAYYLFCDYKNAAQEQISNQFWAFNHWSIKMGATLNNMLVIIPLESGISLFSSIFKYTILK